MELSESIIEGIQIYYSKIDPVNLGISKKNVKYFTFP